MEPGGGRPAVQVVGENEALQQFFCGETSHVLRPEHQETFGSGYPGYQEVGADLRHLVQV